MSDQQREREILNTLTTMQPYAIATICGVRVHKKTIGFYVDGQPTGFAPAAAYRILQLSKERT
jgi:hypothetical protein